MHLLLVVMNFNIVQSVLFFYFFTRYIVHDKSEFCTNLVFLTGKMTATVAHTGTVLPGQDLHCFVCDVAVTGRYYTLATCRTQSTKVRLIEKLGQLVGERYDSFVTFCVIAHFL